MATGVTASDAARAALEARAGGRAVAVVVLAEGAGAGRRLLVFDGGEAAGSLGDPPLDEAGRALGSELLGPGGATAASRSVPGAGGDVTLYAEVHRSTARLFVVGAGHIAVPLAELGVLLGFDVVVLDDREAFATADRFPPDADVRRVDFADPFRDALPGPTDFVVLVTRAHRYDFDCLSRLVLDGPMPRYVGMVGSRRRVRAAFTALLAAGVPRDRLASVHAPIGVGIGAETPAEIALAVAAEIVAVRRGVAPSGSLRDRERILARFLRGG